MSISKIKEDARVALTGKWGKAVCMVLAYLALAFVAFFIGGPVGIILIVTTGIPVSFGITNSFIKLKRGEDVKVYDFLRMGFLNFGRSWKIGLITVLKLIVPIILMIVIGYLFLAGFINATWHLLFENDFVTGILVFNFVIVIGGALAFILGCAVASVLCSPQIQLYKLTSYVAYDNPNMTAREVVNESARIMKENRVKAALLDRSFGGWDIICLFTLGIGYLWLISYRKVATICFYESLLEKNGDKDIEVENTPIREM